MKPHDITIMAVLETVEEFLPRLTADEQAWFYKRVAQHEQKLKNKYGDNSIKREAEKRVKRFKL